MNQYSKEVLPKGACLRDFRIDTQFLCCLIVALRFVSMQCWPFSSVLRPQAVLLQELFGELGSGNHLWELFLIHGVTLFLIVLTVYLKEQHR